MQVASNKSSTKQKKTVKGITCIGILVTVLFLSISVYMYWVGSSIVAESTSIRCPNSGGSMVNGIVEEADLSCPTSRWRKQQSGERLEKLAFFVAMAGVVLGLGGPMLARKIKG